MCIKRKRRGIPHGKEPMFVNVRGGECVSSSCGISMHILSLALMALVGINGT